MAADLIAAGCGHSTPLQRQLDRCALSPQAEGPCPRPPGARYERGLHRVNRDPGRPRRNWADELARIDGLIRDRPHQLGWRLEKSTLEASGPSEMYGNFLSRR